MGLWAAKLITVVQDDLSDHPEIWTKSSQRDLQFINIPTAHSIPHSAHWMSNPDSACISSGCIREHSNANNEPHQSVTMNFAIVLIAASFWNRWLWIGIFDYAWCIKKPHANEGTTDLVWKLNTLQQKGRNIYICS